MRRLRQKSDIEAEAERVHAEAAAYLRNMSSGLAGCRSEKQAAVRCRPWSADAKSEGWSEPRTERCVGGKEGIGVWDFLYLWEEQWQAV